MNSITSLIKRYPQATFWVIAWSTFFFGYSMKTRTGNDMWYFMILAVVITLVSGVNLSRKQETETGAVTAEPQFAS